MREINGRVGAALFLDRLLTPSVDSFAPADDVHLRQYVDLALRGAFPEAVLYLDGLARQNWLESYIEQLVTRAAPAAGGGRDPEKLRRYLEVLAINSAGIVEDKTLHDAAGVSRRTGDAYHQLLQNLFVVEALPAWASNRISRLVRAPKRYLVDPSLIGAILRLDPTTVFRDGNMLGRLVETFVASQIRPELSVATTRPRWYHLRDKGGRHEIDLVIEFGGGRVAGIEITVSAAPSQVDARHLAWLRDELGDRFVTGVVLHTGPRPFRLAENIFAAPISTIWT
jgi:predicted AAA+ superfamily ATPase